MGNKNPLLPILKKPLVSKGLFTLGISIFSTIFFLAPRAAHAGIKEFLMSALTSVLIRPLLSIMAGVISFSSMILNFALTAIAWLAKEILDWAINFALTAPYTSGPIFNSGWTVVRDLANMGLILALIAIGIGTMLSLRLNKSRLFMFIIVALLINFTPIITGIIIDFSNIVAIVFYNAAKESSTAFIGANPAASIASDFQTAIGDIIAIMIGGDFTSVFLKVIVQSMAAIILNIVIIFAFLFLAALFLLRVVALMVLVILSPIAFVGLIFERGAMRNIWNKWWHNFLSWSIIVIPLIFSLWLAGIFINGMDQICSDDSVSFEKITEGKTNNDLDEVLGTIGEEEFICDGASVVFAATVLVFGVIYSFSSSAAGSKIVTKRAQAYWDKGRKKAGKYAKERTKSATRSAARRPASAVSRASERLNRSTLVQGRFSGTPFRAAARAGQAAAEKFKTQTKKEVEGYEKEYKDKTFDQIRGDLYDTGDRGLAAMRYAAKKHPEELAEMMKDDQRIQEAYNLHKKRSTLRGDKLVDDVDKAMPHLIANEIEELSEAIKAAEPGDKESLKRERVELEKNLEKIIEKMSNKDLVNLTPESVGNDLVVKAIQKTGKETTGFLEGILKDGKKASAYNDSVKRMAHKDLLGMSSKDRQKVFGKEPKLLPGQSGYQRLVDDPKIFENITDDSDVFFEKLMAWKEAEGTASVYEKNRTVNPEIAARLKARKNKKKNKTKKT